MALENRADPTGALFRSQSRGMFTGNRGIIHDPVTRTRLGKRWTTQGWICCTLDFRGRRRDVWGRNRPGDKTGWSELFFLDEVSALAAGHRPCFFCRRDDAMRFQAAWARATGQQPSAAAMDRALHEERWLSRKGKPKVLALSDLADLPDGTMIRADNRFYALKASQALPWDFSGYGSSASLSGLERRQLFLVTAPSVLKALQSGYEPLWHPSSGAGAGASAAGLPS